MISKVRTSGKDLIFSSTIIPFEKENPKFSVDVDNLTLNFSFKKDKSAKEREIKSDVSEHSLNIQLINFENPLGTVLTDPWEIGTLTNRILFLSFAVYSIGENHKVVTINLYLGDNV